MTRLKGMRFIRVGRVVNGAIPASKHEASHDRPDAARKMKRRASKASRRRNRR